MITLAKPQQAELDQQERMVIPTMDTMRPTGHKGWQAVINAKTEDIADNLLVAFGLACAGGILAWYWAQERKANGL